MVCLDLLGFVFLTVLWSPLLPAADVPLGPPWGGTPEEQGTNHGPWEGAEAAGSCAGNGPFAASPLPSPCCSPSLTACPGQTPLGILAPGTSPQHLLLGTPVQDGNPVMGTQHLGKSHLQILRFHPIFLLREMNKNSSGASGGTFLITAPVQCWPWRQVLDGAPLSCEGYAG